MFPKLSTQPKRKDVALETTEILAGYSMHFEEESFDPRLSQDGVELSSKLHSCAYTCMYLCG